MNRIQVAVLALLLLALSARGAVAGPWYYRHTVGKCVPTSMNLLLDISNRYAHRIHDNRCVYQHQKSHNFELLVCDYQITLLYSVTSLKGCQDGVAASQSLTH